jgi:hypothetical protein
MVFLIPAKRGTCAGTSNFVTPAESWTTFYFPVHEKHGQSGLPDKELKTPCTNRE